MNPFRAIFYLAVLLVFLAITIPIGILMLLLDIDFAEDNAPAWVNLAPPPLAVDAPIALPTPEPARTQGVPA